MITLDNPMPIRLSREMPGYSAVVTSDTIVVVAGTIIRSLKITADRALFQDLKAAIEQERPLAVIAGMLQQAK